MKEPRSLAPPSVLSDANRTRAWRQWKQLHKVAAIQRKLIHRLLGYDCSEFGCRRCTVGCLRIKGYRFLLRADGGMEIVGRRLIDENLKWRLRFRKEAFFNHLQRISGRQNIDQNISPGSIGCGDSYHTGVSRDQSDFRSVHDSAGRVTNDAVNRSGRCAEARLA